jgi:hypothetical protein
VARLGGAGGLSAHEPLGLENLFVYHRRVSTADQILAAWLTAAAKRNARDRTVTTEQAVAEIRELAGHRPDLLAECAALALRSRLTQRPMSTAGGPTSSHL